MEKFSLQTFIKISLMDTGSRITEIQKKLSQTAGYDFYNSFQRAVRVFCEDKHSARPDEILSAPVKESERKYNAEGFSKFKLKFGASKTLEAVKKPKLYIPEGAEFEISIDPLFSLEKAGVRYAYLPWLMQKPELSQRYAAVACYVMRQAYKGTNLSNCQFNIVDLNKGKIHSENKINDNTPIILVSDTRSISALLKDL